MYRFFIKEEQIHDGMIEICGSDVNHIKNVLRMKTGDKVYLSNGSDLEYECSLLEWTDDTILAKIEDVHGMETELPVKITLYQGLPKGDKMEMIVQKAVELGVAEIVPVAMKRCVVKLDAKKAAKKVSRWNTIALSAAKQAKRGIIPEVREVRNFKDILEEVQDTEFMLVPYAGVFVPARTKTAGIPGRSSASPIPPKCGKGLPGAGPSLPGRRDCRCARSAWPAKKRRCRRQKCGRWYRSWRGPPAVGASARIRRYRAQRSHRPGNRPAETRPGK